MRTCHSHQESCQDRAHTVVAKASASRVAAVMRATNITAGWRRWVVMNRAAEKTYAAIPNPAIRLSAPADCSGRGVASGGSSATETTPQATMMASSVSLIADLVLDDPRRTSR